MNGWKEMNPGVKVLIFLAVFILLGLIAAIFIIFRSQGELDRELAKLKRAGEPITIKDLRPAPVADKDNAAFVYKKIFALMTAKNHPFSAEYRGDLKPEINKLEKFYRGKAPLHDLNKNEKAELYNILDSKLIAEIITLAGQAVEKPGFNFDLDYEKGFGMLLPHLTPYRGLSKILAAKAWQLANENKPEAAIKLCVIGLKQAGQLRDEPILISQLVRYACGAIILKRLNEIIAEHGINERQSVEILKILRRWNLCESMKNGFRGERVMTLHDAFNPALEGKAFGKEKKDFNLFGLGVFRFITRKDYICYLKLMSQHIAAYDKKYWEIPDAEKESKYWNEKIPFYCIRSRMLLPALNLCRQKTAASQILVDKVIIGILLEKYKKAHAEYPAALSALDGNLPKDPFTGKAFIYQLHGKSYNLTSAGDKKERKRPRR